MAVKLLLDPLGSHNGEDGPYLLFPADKHTTDILVRPTSFGLTFVGKGLVHCLPLNHTTGWALKLVSNDEVTEGAGSSKIGHLALDRGDVPALVWAVTLALDNSGQGGTDVDEYESALRAVLRSLGRLGEGINK